MPAIINRQALVVLVTIGMILILFWSVWFYFNRLAWRVREQTLVDRLENIGKGLTREIEQDDAALVLEFAEPSQSFYSPAILNWLPQTAAYDQLTTHLTAYLNNPRLGLSSLLVLDGQGQTLLDADGEYLPGEPYSLAGERGLFEAALRGEPAFSPPSRRSVYKFAYFPLRNQARRVTALLRIEVYRTWFDELERQRNRLRLAGLLVTGLLLTLGWAQIRTLNRLGQMERAMAQKDRLRSLGTLAAGLAHEMRNPLGIMRATAEEILGEARQQPPIHALAGDLIGEIDRLNALLNQVLEFSKPQDHLPGEEPRCDLRETLEQALPLFQKNLRHPGVELLLRLPPGSLPVKIHPNALRQIIFNLLLNAADAVGERGKIEVRAEELPPGRVRVRIRDDGCGIDPKILGRVFDPFFSTKDKGAGLGLSISRQTAERNGGSLLLSSKPGEGTEVVLEFPRGSKS